MSRTSPGEYVELSEKIVSLIVDGLHGEAMSVIDAAETQIPKEEHKRLAALVRIDQAKPENVAHTTESRRRAYERNGTWLAHLYTLGVDLMDIEYWADAEVAFDEVVALSKAKGEMFFHDEAKLLRGLCLKYLGRRSEMEALKAEISSDTGAFICREDLGGCILLTRDHLS